MNKKIICELKNFPAIDDKTSRQDTDITIIITF